VHVPPQHCQLIILGQKRSLGLLLEKEVEQIFFAHNTFDGYGTMHALQKKATAMQACHAH
jgi:hypothetical protein